MSFFNWLSQVFVSIVGVIESLISFVFNLILSLVQFLGLLPNILNFATSSLNGLPSLAATFAGISLVIFILYQILGRSDN